MLLDEKLHASIMSKGKRKKLVSFANAAKSITDLSLALVISKTNYDRARKTS
jgi:hypothetical protein